MLFFQVNDFTPEEEAAVIAENKWFSKYDNLRWRSRERFDLDFRRFHRWCAILLSRDHSLNLDDLFDRSSARCDRPRIFDVHRIFRLISPPIRSANTSGAVHASSPRTRSTSCSACGRIRSASAATLRIMGFLTVLAGGTTAEQMQQQKYVRCWLCFWRSTSLPHLCAAIRFDAHRSAERVPRVASCDERTGLHPLHLRATYSMAHPCRFVGQITDASPATSVAGHEVGTVDALALECPQCAPVMARCRPGSPCTATTARSPAVDLIGMAVASCSSSRSSNGRPRRARRSNASRVASSSHGDSPLRCSFDSAAWQDFCVSC